jgi:hypothetical protein
MARRGRQAASNGRLAHLIVIGAVLAGCGVTQATIASGSTRDPRFAGTIVGRARARQTSHAVSRSPRVRTAIVGGSEIEIRSAPWQVTVYSQFGSQVKLCGGTIIDVSHILTAAHCIVESETGYRIPAGDFAVFAGVSHFDFHTAKLSEGSAVESIRVDPYFEVDRSPDADDVAILVLHEPLKATVTVQPIELDDVSATPPEGTAVNLTGFGLEEPEVGPNGNLYSLGFTVGYSRRCGGEADALLVCASAAMGSSCFGDSGSPLTSLGPTPALVGILDFGIVSAGEEHCSDGEMHGFANVAAPEIRDFIEGSEAPPRAPRGGGAIIRGVPEVGRRFTCEPGTWTAEPTYTFVFIDSASGTVLQRGASSTYISPGAEAGGSVLCEVMASNAGGIGIGRTSGLGPIRPAPVRPVSEVTPAAPEPESPILTPPLSTVSLVASSIAVHGDLAAVKLTCHGTASCRGKLTLIARRTVNRRGVKKLQAVAIGTLIFAIAGGHTTPVKVRLTSVGRGMLSVDRGHLSASLALLGLATDPITWQSHDVRLMRQASRGKG